MTLTTTEKVALVKALSPQHKARLRKHLREHLQTGMGMSGRGLLSFLSSIGKALLPIVKTVGMPILKEVLLPAGIAALKKKMGGQGPSLPGRGPSLPGRGVKLAGQGVKLAGQGVGIYPGQGLRLAGQRGRGKRGSRSK